MRARELKTSTGGDRDTEGETAGDHACAKETVTGLLREFGWPEEAVVDLGGIRSARGTEMYMPLYFTLAGVLGAFDFNIAVVRPQ